MCLSGSERCQFAMSLGHRATEGLSGCLGDWAVVSYFVRQVCKSNRPGPGAVVVGYVLRLIKWLSASSLCRTVTPCV